MSQRRAVFRIFALTLLLPYANLFWTNVLTVIIGLRMASAFPAILVYAQALVPGRIGMISGVFFGFTVGPGGLGAAATGRIADATSVGFIYQLCSDRTGHLAAAEPGPNAPACALYSTRAPEAFNSCAHLAYSDSM